MTNQINLHAHAKKSSSSALLRTASRFMEYHTSIINNNTSAAGTGGDQPDWDYWVNKSLSSEPSAVEKSSSQSLFDLILNKDEQPNTQVSSARNETLENFFATQAEERLQQEQFETLESAFQQFTDLIRPQTSKRDLKYMYPLRINEEEYKATSEQIDQETERELEGLSEEEIDKIFWDAKLENQLAKGKAFLNKQVNLGDFVINTEIEAERVTLEQARRAFKVAREKQANMSDLERKVEQLTKSYGYSLQEKKRQQCFESEKEKREQMYNVFKKQADSNPEAFKTFSQGILSKKGVSVDFIMENYVNGVSIEEITKMILSKQNPELAKASYEIDSFAPIRNAVQTYIENRQQYCRDVLGIKSGKRHANGITLHVDRAITKGDNLSFLRSRLNAIRDQDRIERTVWNLNTLNTPTKSQKAARSARTAKRRLEGQKLDNTMKVFMWVKKYRNKILK